MSSKTINKGLIYPRLTDYADVQDSYNLAAQVDGLIEGYDRAFIGAGNPTAFLQRTTANGSGSTNSSVQPGTAVVEYDPTGGSFSSGTQLGWAQPKQEGPSWYLIGFDALLAITAGAAGLGNNFQSRIFVDTSDPLSGVVTVTPYYHQVFETVNGGEHINGLAIVRVWNGSFSPDVTFSALSGTATYVIATGSRFWGMRLGAG